MKPQIYHLVVLLFFSITISLKADAQLQGQEKIDSLFDELKKAKEDTNMLKILSLLAENLPDSIWPYYNHQMGSLVQKLQIENSSIKKQTLKKYESDYLNNLGLINKQSGNINKALKYYLLSLKIRELIGDLNAVAESQNNIGVLYFEQGDIPKAIEYYNKSLNSVEIMGDKNKIASSLLNIGLLNKHIGNLDGALKYYKRSLQVINETEEKNIIATVLNNIAVIYQDQGNIPKAIEIYYKSIKIYEELNDKRGKALLLNNLGRIYDLQGEYQLALNHFLNCLKIRDDIQDQRGIASSLQNIAAIYKKLGKQENAIEFLQKALIIQEIINDKNGMAYTLSAIGEIIKEKGDLDGALIYFKKSLHIRDSIKFKAGVIFSLLNIGNIYYDMDKIAQARIFGNKAYILSKELGSLEPLKGSANLLYLANKKSRYFKDALEMFEIYILINDSIKNEANQKTLIRSEFQYKFEKEQSLFKVEQEKRDALSQAEISRQKLNRNYTAGGFSILLLGSGLFAFLFNQKRKSQFKNQVSEVEMKALRSQMNPHFIFNSLNSIDDYVQHHDIDNSSLYINKFARLMRKILENSRMEQVPLHDDLEVLELYIQMENLRMKKKVAYSINISPAVNAEQVLIQPLLLQPFVENAFKHAFAGIGQPTLEINVILKGDMIHCEVKDNGKGRGSKQEVVIETKEQRESLGLKVTQERLNIFNKIKKTKAYIAFEDLKDANFNAIGTRVEVAVPVSYAF